MPVSEAKKKANAKWDSENMATLACKVKKTQAEQFKSYCKMQGKTSNTILREYVLTCIGEENRVISETIERDNGTAVSVASQVALVEETPIPDETQKAVAFRNAVDLIAEKYKISHWDLLDELGQMKKRLSNEGGNPNE